MAIGDRNDPYTTYNFKLEIDGLTLGSFTEVTGLMVEGNAIEYREGNEQNWTRQLVGLRTQSTITLKRGMTQNRELWDWSVNIGRGVLDRRDGVIILMNEAREDVLRWSFRQGWPNKIDGPSLNAIGTEVAMESLEIKHEGLELVQ
ncbi:MAG: phage tail protein [Pseudomonadota bacterium]